MKVRVSGFFAEINSVLTTSKFYQRILKLGLTSQSTFDHLVNVPGIRSYIVSSGSIANINLLTWPVNNAPATGKIPTIADFHRSTPEQLKPEYI